MQLVADVKLLYNLDCFELGSRLLAMYERVLKESSTRCKDYSQLTDDFRRRTEDASADVVKGNYLILPLPTWCHYRRNDFLLSYY